VQEVPEGKVTEVRVARCLLPIRTRETCARAEVN